ncbi:PEP-CTERM sorting domain-containing protein [Nostoc sp. CENA67]|uniref:PEP-CTERM sorting domain-containing protein n=1 Tax=Amazonocrinis nigriterrae CENA67 TaxID=2794033 RepID=A0A8J7LBP0_9NOST|nr:PEP-CTERM sorting domain-containing protein [Amazonocrinis nigriterrae]MBH8566963.1 PEP-CTERM sorting domain-containing protein [Amazonocrinis nigriterrae CENA67]
MFNSHTAWLIPLTLTIVSFGSNIERATAETTKTYTFNADYKTLVTIDTSYRPDLDIIRATITGESVEPAPYGLNFFTSNTYGKLESSDNASIIKYTFNSDPTVFGLTDAPLLYDRYYGGANELFGRASDSAEINFVQETIKGGGTISIFGGTGLFKNATGTISFTEEDKLNLSGSPSEGLAKLTFTLQTPQSVPEPTATTTLIGMGLIGAGLILKRCRYKTFL